MHQLQCLQYREVDIACTRFVQIFLRFSHPQTAQNNSQKTQTQKINPFIQIQPRLRSHFAKTQTTLKPSYNRDYVLFMYII